jgi:hypothetical protein
MYLSAADAETATATAAREAAVRERMAFMVDLLSRFGLAIEDSIEGGRNDGATAA